MKTLKITMLVLTAWGLSACSGNIIPQDATTPDKAAAVGLEMQKQEVRRLDCNGNVTSDGIEVVSPPTSFMELHPTRASWTYDNIESSSFTDEQTASSPSMIISKVKFTIDHGDGYLNMKVSTGVNEIKYHFLFADGVSEEGSRFINVSYTETVLPGVSVVKPTPDQCPPPTPAPPPSH